MIVINKREGQVIDDKTSLENFARAYYADKIGTTIDVALLFAYIFANHEHHPDNDRPFVYSDDLWEFIKKNSTK